MWEAIKLTQSGEYHDLCGMTTFTEPDDETPHSLLVPIESWQDFLISLDVIFESKINRKLVQRTIRQVVCQLTEFPFTEVMLKDYSKTVFKEIWQHYLLSAEALVPLYNITLEGNVEIPLANAVLCSGNPNSLLAEKAGHSILETLVSLPEDVCFLQIQVTGDDESQLRQVDLEVEKSLIVLRFVTMWRSRIEGTRRIKYNPASAVTTREQGKRHIIYHKPENPAGRPGFHGDFAQLFYLWRKEIEVAYDHYGLEDLNYHHSNLDNPISRRVVRALELYDSGVQAKTNWQAFYRYIVSINVVLPKSGSKGKVLVERLTTLIQYGGDYVGSMRIGDDDADPESITWEEMVRRTAEPFENFYTLRGKILHGNL